MSWNYIKSVVKYGPGHFDMTLVLGQNGLNEDEWNILRHLEHFKKNLIFVRSKSDSDITGIVNQEHENSDGSRVMSRDDAYRILERDTKEYVRSNLKKPIEIFFTGLPHSNFPDYQKIMDLIRYAQTWKMPIFDGMKYLLQIKQEYTPG